MLLAGDSVILAARLIWSVGLAVRIPASQTAIFAENPQVNMYEDLFKV